MKDKVHVTTHEAITIVLFTVFIWFVGYITGAEVTPIWEKTMVKFDCIFQPAPHTHRQLCLLNQ